MASMSSIPNGLRAILAGVILAGVYLAYARVTQPWLNADRRISTVPRTSAPQERSPVFAAEAERWFREDPWVRNANGRFRDGGRLLFFQKKELFNENRSIRVEPIAMMWRTEEGQEPFTVTADSAQLDSSKRFSLSEGEFGRITSGLLTGDFRIRGPDNLKIEGRMLHISEDAMKAWTNQPLSFVWGTHRGLAEGGAEIDLSASREGSPGGLTEVSDVQSIRLLGRVTCNLEFNDPDSEREPVHLKVSAANGFEFFFPTRQATFLGFTDRKVLPDNQVLIERPSADGQLDLLHCSRLVLQFQPKIAEAEAGARSSTQLNLTLMTAEGQPVIFSSRKNGQESIHARMRTLRYLIESRQLELLEGVTATDGRRVRVEVHQGGNQLTTGYLLATLDDANELNSVKAIGPGQIGASTRPQHPRTDPTQAVDAVWTESMTLKRGPDTSLTLSGSAEVVHPETKFRLSGERLEMYLSEDAAEEQNFDSETENVSPISLGALKPKRLIGVGDVGLEAQTAHVSGRARDRLEVTFEQAQPSDPALESSTGSRKTAVTAVSQTAGSGRPVSETEFSTDTLEAVVVLPPRGDPEFRDVWLKGDVSVDHANETPEKSFAANCNVLNARNGFQSGREITLFGDPAVITSSSNRVEGKQIDLGESGTARVEGSGRIRYVVSRGLNGEVLSRQSPLDIYWGDHMEVRGKTAHFVGNIRAVMNNEIDHDIELTCAGMKVHFTSELQQRPRQRSAESEQSDLPAGEIERIECESRVVIDIDQMEDGVVTARHHAEFSDLVFNQVTGEFHGTGPGLIQSSQPDTNRKLAASSRVVARSNVPSATSDSQFVFLHATFIGELTGNRNTHFVQIRQHVRGLFGPVRELDEVISIDGLSVEEFPENTGSLECENLSISEIQGADGDPGSFSLVAETNPESAETSGTRSPCRIESRMFSGNADKIKYDHSKQQFVLNAEGHRQATVSWRRNGGEPESLTGGSFTYYHATNQLKATQIRAVQASEL